jgi:hypothetical protein
MRRLFVLASLGPLLASTADAFSIQPLPTRYAGCRPTLVASASPPSDEDREYARVRRGGRGRPEREANEDDDFSTERREAYLENEEDWEDLEDVLFGDEDDDDYDDDDEDYELLGDVLIPNPLLDSIDPDGASERFPELASDPKFWLDMVLFVAFLNFLSGVGPQDPFPDIPWY